MVSGIAKLQGAGPNNQTELSMNEQPLAKSRVISYVLMYFVWTDLDQYKQQCFIFHKVSNT